ncbi:hypothetical protein VTO42DRAFT_2626 [Malbranchea cinnamomea]
MKFFAVLATAIAAAGALAAPAPPHPTDLVWPSGTFRYWVKTGHVVADPQDQLLVVKDGNQDHETTTIVSFDAQPDLAGRTCRLIFDLWDRDVSTGTQQVDVFSYVDPPVYTFNAANVADVRPASYRDKHKGRLRLPKPGRGEWLVAYDGYPEFPCPQNTVAVEFVGVGDRVEVRWDIGVTGPRLEVVEE